MSALDTAYKLGSRTAVGELTAWLQNDDGNPTAYPKRRGSILKTAVIDTGGGMGERPQPVSPQLKTPSWAQDEPAAPSPAISQGVSDAFSGVKLPSFASMMQRGQRTARPAARPTPRSAGSAAAASTFNPDPSQMSMAPKPDVYTGHLGSSAKASPSGQMSMAARPDVFTGEPSPRGMSMAPKAAPSAVASKSDVFTGGGMPADVMTGQSRMPQAAPSAVASKSDTYTGHLGGGGKPADVMTGQSRMPTATSAAQAKADVYTGHLPQKVSHVVHRAAATIRKTANIMTPNPNLNAPPAQPMPSTGAAGNAIGKPAPGAGGTAPVTPPPSASSGGGGRAVTASVHRIKMAIMGGKGQNCREMPEICNPGGAAAPPPPPPKPVTPPPKTAADRAVEQVMRKLGKSMSRRPLSRDGTKFESLKKKLRKQKPKKD